jgi:hypothetical protein
MRISSPSHYGLALEHKQTLLQSRTSEREAGAGAGAEREDTDALETMTAAEVVRGDTRDGHVQEMATKTDDTDTRETIATVTATATTDTVRQQTTQSAGNTTIDAIAQGQDLESVEDTAPARRERGETEKETAIDTDVMIERQHTYTQRYHHEGREYEQISGREKGSSGYIEALIAKLVSVDEPGQDWWGNLMLSTSPPTIFTLSFRGRATVQTSK